MSEARKLSASEATRVNSGRCAEHGLRACEECAGPDTATIDALNIIVAVARHESKSLLARVAELEAALGAIVEGWPDESLPSKFNDAQRIARAALAGK